MYHDFIKKELLLRNYSKNKYIHMAKDAEKDPKELDNTLTLPTESTTPEEDAWLSGMESKYPDLKGNREALYKASREGYDKEHNLNKENADAYRKINDAIERSPEAARVINGLVNPEEGAEPEEAFAEFGEDLVDLLTGKIDNETYRNKKKELADKSAAEKAAQEEQNAAIGKAYTDACAELGLDPEETQKALVAKFNGEDATDFMANKEFFVALIRSMNYDDDMLAAEARGRNAQMSEKNARRSAGTDGLPHAGSGSGQAKKYNPNSLAAMAEQRRRMNS